MEDPRQLPGLVDFSLYSGAYRLGGYEAVTLFYVLSGLVLALPWVEERPPEYRKYAIRRMCRLYIPYVVGIVAAGVLNVALLQHAYVSGASQWVNSMTWTNPVTPFVLFDHFAIIGHHAPSTASPTP